jgi:hypothetical protein
MPTRIDTNNPLVIEVAKAAMISADRIQHFVLVVQYDKGVQLIHTMCCNEHAREGLAAVAATPPDIPDS